MKKRIVNAALESRVNAVVARRAAKAAVARGLSGDKAESKRWFNIANATDDEADIYIYDEISGSPWYGTGANDLVEALEDVTAKTLNVHLNSPGGSVFEGFAIYSIFVAYAEKHNAKINVKIDGWAASIASVIAMAGDHIAIGEHASFMIHSPWSWVIGDAEEMRAEADVLDDLEETIIDIYVARTDGDRDEIKAWVKNETWFKGQKAVDAGFADEVVSLKRKKDGDAEDKAKPAASHDAAYFKAIFPNMPDDVREALVKQPVASGEKNKPLPKDKRELAACLREIGFSRDAADSIAAHGFKPKSDPRDGAPELEKPTTSDPRDGADERANMLAAIRNAATAAAIRAA